MNIHSDLSVTAHVRRETADWISSPQAGVDRLLLDRTGGEMATRATTFVRYQPGASFPAHIHPGGEEYLVLDGVFSDASGNFSEGFYVRNPVGSRHAPFSKTGAEIFVKLGQIDPEDQTYVRLDTKGADWQTKPALGLKTLQLHRFGSELVRLVSFEAGCSFPETAFEDGVEILVVSGGLDLSGLAFKKGDWIRSARETDLRISSRTDTIFMLKTGHLPRTKS